MQEPKIEKKRVFFGAEVTAPWPDRFPSGRLLGESSRHMTLAFLGNVPFEPLREVMSCLPLPDFTVGPSGIFDACLLLPRRRPRVLAWHARWLSQGEAIARYQDLMCCRLRDAGYAIDRREFLPHVTLARAPMAQREWRRAFKPLPFLVPAIHLYESVGNLVYEPVWTHPLTPPFTPDAMAGAPGQSVSGESLPALQANALAALAYQYPDYTETLTQFPYPEPRDPEDICRVLETTRREAGLIPGPEVRIASTAAGTWVMKMSG